MREKVAIYCRLSEEDRNKQTPQEDSASIQNQKTMLQQYAKEQGWEVCRVYSDDDYAGADRKRPAFNRLLRDAEQGAFEIILCKTLSRFTRELELVERYVHGLFPLWGIRFIGLVDHVDTDVKGNKKSRQITGLMNEWYLEDMSENIRSVLTNRRMNGYHIGSSALYGYRKDPDQKGHLLIDDDAAAVVREIFTQYAQGCGKTAIARSLNARGVPTPAEHKRRYMQSRKGTDGVAPLWQYATISQILTNEMYLGHMVQGRYGSISYKSKQNKPRPRKDWYVVENTHEPIISQMLWDRVQVLIAQKLKPLTTQGRVGLFAGKVRCAHCGYMMRSSKNHGRHYLQCRTRYVCRDACVGAFISAECLEHTVLDELRCISERDLDMEAVYRGVDPDRQLRQRQEDARARLQRERGELETYSTALCELYMEKVRGVIDESAFSDMMCTLRTRRTELEQRVAEEERSIAMLDAYMTSDRDHRAWVARALAPDHLTREMVEMLIEDIEVSKKDPVTHTTAIVIHWKF